MSPVIEAAFFYETSVLIVLIKLNKRGDTQASQARSVTLSSVYNIK